MLLWTIISPAHLSETATTTRSTFPGRTSWTQSRHGLSKLSGPSGCLSVDPVSRMGNWMAISTALQRWSQTPNIARRHKRASSTTPCAPRRSKSTPTLLHDRSCLTAIKLLTECLSNRVPKTILCALRERSSSRQEHSNHLNC